MTATPTPARLVHQALVYGDDERFLAATVPFCRDGLERGDAVLAVTTAHNTAMLRDTLGTEAARIEFADADTWYDAPGRTLAAYQRYVDRSSTPRRRTRIIGEPVWQGRDATRVQAWTRYESAINVAFADSPAWIICPYDTRTVPAPIVHDALRTHPHLAGTPTPDPSPAYQEPADFTTGPPSPIDPAAVVLRFDRDLSAVRHFAATTATSLGLPPDKLDDLVIAVNEVATNTVRHGGGSGHLTLWRTADTIVCDITDTGPRPVTDWYLGYLRPGSHLARGHGMWIVRQLCDIVEIHPRTSGTTVRLHLRIT
ncbi:sensor histidine kinase [Saccharothrix yanglingensis]|uniref:sensor histidine kinase n=1 Tax=Saccharothrix yanglingensis TaxID=659496 RepID=UPI0027D22FDA|nr:sensor histidine kinase [Saccharothrix yanglingensis]